MQELERHEPARRREGRFRLYGLLAVNAVLLLTLGAVTFGRSSTAQVRVRGDYAMVAGGIQGAGANGLYIVDTTNRELIAIAYEPNQKELLGIGYRNLTADADSMQRRGSSR